MNNPSEKLSTLREVAQRFKVSERTVQRWLNIGDIEALYIGRQRRFEEKEVRRFMDLRRRARVRKAS